MPRSSERFSPAAHPTQRPDQPGILPSCRDTHPPVTNRNLPHDDCPTGIISFRARVTVRRRAAGWKIRNFRACRQMLKHCGSSYEETFRAATSRLMGKGLYAPLNIYWVQCRARMSVSVDVTARLRTLRSAARPRSWNARYRRCSTKSTILKSA